MYIEESFILDVSVPNSVDADVLYIGDDVQLNIVAQEPGDACGLPATCFCPQQYSVHISPKMSVHNLISNDSHRVFGYHDGERSYNLLTRSVSTSVTCRRPEEEPQEATYLTWFDPKHYDAYEKSIFGTGYVSDAKFFQINGVVHVAVVRFYDPETDSHNVDCVVMKQSSELTEPVRNESINRDILYRLPYRILVI